MFNAMTIYVIIRKVRVGIAGFCTKKDGLKRISAMSSAYWMSIKYFGDLFYPPKSLPHCSQIKICQ